MKRVWAAACIALTLAVSACGGGDDDRAATAGAPSPALVGSPAPSGSTGGGGTGGSTPAAPAPATGSSAPAAPPETAGPGTGSDGSGTGTGTGAGTGTGVGTSAGSGSGTGSGGTGVGNDGTGVAGGVGSGGTGVSGDGGVGSGGTGSPASAAVSVGTVDGFGSIIVGSVRYEVGSATFQLSDATELKLGMTVRVAGTVTSDLTRGTATSVMSAADLRGVVTAVQAGTGFTVLGMQVTLDEATVFDGVASLASLAVGDTVQVHGLPGRSELRASRVERIAAGAAPVVSGVVQDIDTGARSFRLGTLLVNYAGANVTAAPLANGRTVRVRASATPAGATLAATLVEDWYTLPTTPGTQAALTGLVSDTSGSTFRLEGVTVDASAAQVSGGPAGSLGNGVKVEAIGTYNASGVLVASKVKIRHIPGSGGPVAFSTTGKITQFDSPASFKVQGQRVDASGAGVVFSGGSAADLANGRKVAVQGANVNAGALLADRVEFLAD